MKRTPASTLALCLLAATAARGQSVGVAGSYRIGLLEVDRLTDHWRSWCACDAAGSALAHQTLFTATFLYADEVLPVAAGARLGFGTGQTSFVSPSYPALRPDLPSDAQLQYRESIRSTTLRVDLEGRVRTGGVVSLMIGPWFETVLASTLERREQIVAPGGAVFPGEGESRDLIGAPVVSSDDLRWGMALGVSLSVPMSSTVDLVPSVMLESDLQGLGRSRPGALMLAFGTAVVFDVSGGGLRAGSPIAAPSAQRLPPAPTMATISLFAIEGGRHLRTAVARREREYHRIVAQMPRSFVLTAASDAEPTAFTSASLIGATVDEIEARALDVLGERMRAQPASRLRVVAQVEPGLSAVATRDRVRRTREHLARRWSVDPARLVVTTEVAKKVMSSSDALWRLHIASTSPALTAPIVVEWADERLTLPQLGVDPVIDAPHGVRATTLRLLRGGRTLAEGTVADAAALGDLAIDLSDALEGGTPAPIVAELEVVDSTGATTRVRDELALEVRDETEGRGFDRERITLVLRDDADRMMLAELERALQPGARVAVHPGGDVRGTTQAALAGTLDAVRGILRRRGVRVEEVVAAGDAVAGSVRVDVEIDARTH